MPTNKRLIAFLFAVGSSVLLIASGEPYALGVVAWIALVPLYLAIFRERRWRWSFAYGFVCALGFFAVHMSWKIISAGAIGWAPLVVVLSLYVGTAGLVSGVVRRWPLAPVLAAGAWVGAELLRDRWPFDGYPWGALGTTQAAVPGVRWLAGVIGVYGLSFLAAFAAALIADRFVAGRWAWGSMALVGGVLAIFVAVDVVRYGSPPAGETVRIGVVQGNVPRPVVPDQRDRILESHIELTRTLSSREEVDFIVWPEDAIGIGVSPGAEERVSDVAREAGVPILVGRSDVDRDRRVDFNRVHQVAADGRWVDSYQKQHPVPFGEYVPLSFLREYVGALDAIPYDQVPGTEPVVFDVDGIAVGTPICFESVFPRDVRGFVAEGAELLVVSTNNASFGRSPASDQHIAHARMRALENRQWIVQAALSGKSAVVAPDGSLTQETGLFERAVFVAEVEARPASSLYARIGDWFPGIWARLTGGALLVYAGIVVFGRIRDRFGGRPEPERSSPVGTRR